MKQPLDFAPLLLTAFTMRIFKFLTCHETKAVYQNNQNLVKES